MLNEKDFGRKEQDTLEIEGDLERKTFRVKATGNVAWGICMLGVAVVGSLFMPTKTTEISFPNTKFMIP